MTALLRRALRVPVTCSEACTLVLRLLADRPTARRLGLTSAAKVTIGRGAGALNAAGRTRVTVRLTRKAARAFQKVARARFELSILAVDRAGNRTIATRVVRARR